MDNDNPICPWCGSEFYSATVEVGLTWFTCDHCECMWSANNEDEVTR